jgi:hypothetical protein
MTSMVFQSGTEKRARFPSKVMTPEKTWWTRLLVFYDILFVMGACALTSQRTSPQRRAMANGSTAVVS